MVKMYLAEVLGKLPVVQHFLFGSILTWEGEFPERHDESQCGHDHSRPEAREAGGWGDCCGIPIPSIFGAADAEKTHGVPLSGPNIRPVPFD
jgi:serine/threonine-protein phosphatase 2A activator